MLAFFSWLARSGLRAGALCPGTAYLAVTPLLCAFAACEGAVVSCCRGFVDCAREAQSNRYEGHGRNVNIRALRDADSVASGWGGLEGFVAIPVGAFADPKFPGPTFSVYEDRMHSWISMPPGIEHMA